MNRKLGDKEILQIRSIKFCKYSGEVGRNHIHSNMTSMTMTLIKDIKVFVNEVDSQKRWHTIVY